MYVTILRSWTQVTDLEFSTSNVCCFSLIYRKNDAANRPKAEFVPKTLADIHVDIAESMNGGSVFHTQSYGQDNDPFDPWSSKPPLRNGLWCFAFICFFTQYILYRIDYNSL